MFNKISQSIFNSSINSSTTSDKMTPATNPTHKCNEEGCTPSKFSGCNFICSRCLTPKFVDCISDRTEIIELMNALRISSDGTTVQSIINENVNKINNLFGRESLFEFVCPACKKEGTYLEMKLKHESKIKNAQLKNKKLSEEISGMKNQLETSKKNNTDSQCKECPNLNEINNQLKSDIDNLNKRLEEFKCNECDKSSSALISIGTLSADVLSLLEGLNSNWNVFQASAAKYHNDISAQLHSLNLCIPTLNVDDVQNDGETSSNNHVNSGLNVNSSTFEPSKSAKIDKNNESNTPPNVNVRNQFKAPTKPTTNNTNMNTSSDTNKLHVIHVSPFETSVESNQIVDYIIGETDISDPNYFSVEKLIGPREDMQRKTYVSFKISMFSEQVYNKIMNKTLWEPNQNARKFEPRSTKKNDQGLKRITSNRFQMNNYNSDRGNVDPNNNYKSSNKFVRPPSFENGSNFVRRDPPTQSNDYRSKNFNHRQQQQQQPLYFRQSDPPTRFANRTYDEHDQSQMRNDYYRPHHDDYQQKRYQQRPRWQQQQQYPPNQQQQQQTQQQYRYRDRRPSINNSRLNNENNYQQSQSQYRTQHDINEHINQNFLCPEPNYNRRNSNTFNNNRYNQYGSTNTVYRV